MLYADDLVILSEIAQHLQDTLNKLDIYCKTWRFQLNIKKPKVMIFSNRHKVEGHNFTFGTEKIAIVDSYTYLLSSDNIYKKCKLKRSSYAPVKVSHGVHPPS